MEDRDSLDAYLLSVDEYGSQIHILPAFHGIADFAEDWLLNV